MIFQVSVLLRSLVLVLLASLALALPAWAVEPFTVRDIRVEGLQRIEPGTVFASLPFRVGDTYNDEKGVAALRALFAAYGLSSEEVCCIGDDEPDLPMLTAAGVSAAPSSAVPVVLGSVDIVTTAPGGRGAVRELLDMIHAARARR